MALSVRRVREQTSVLRHRVSPYDDEFTQIHIPVKTSIQTGFETASRVFELFKNYALQVVLD